MGAQVAAFGLLFDAVDSVKSFVDVFVVVYILVVFVYVLTSWIPLPYSPAVSRVQRFLYDVCNPYLRLFRRVLPPLGPLDLSPVVAVVVLYAIKRGLDAVLVRLH
jgi:YggT family protein